MRSTATWRSMGQRASERRYGWCRAMYARLSICTTKSGTAAAAEWKEAGRSLRVGKYARTDARTLARTAGGLTLGAEHGEYYLRPRDPRRTRDGSRVQTRCGPQYRATRWTNHRHHDGTRTWPRHDRCARPRRRAWVH